VTWCIVFDKLDDIQKKYMISLYFALFIVFHMKLVRINRSRMFAYKETCLDSCRAITAISDILFIKFDKDVDIRQPALVHVPIVNDIDDPESEIVMFRQDTNGEVHVTQMKSVVRCESTGNCYTFQVEAFNGFVMKIVT